MKKLKGSKSPIKTQETRKENPSLPPCAELPDPCPGCIYQARQRVISPQGRDHCPAAVAPPGPVFTPAWTGDKAEIPGEHQQGFTCAAHRYQRSPQFPPIQAELFTPG